MMGIGMCICLPNLIEIG